MLGKIIRLPPKLIFVVFFYLPSQKDQFFFGMTFKYFFSVYWKVINDPRQYKFFEMKPRCAEMINPVIYEFKEIKKNFVTFDRRYQRCVECRARRMCCDRKEVCHYCKKNNFQCVKKKRSSEKGYIRWITERGIVLSTP
ncbi:hypothetical protein C2G38_892702 [Gigaspora rosea]|uniref:Zn(2)-C6 fungal-type domain-containing protein n=1 Tax=Gigaspora rosea TaxID=44941 RepID=A0A397VVZ2_9GLOM|nr:hypothetical protein C2G38_892702 [Gigaspora rosea]